MQSETLDEATALVDAIADVARSILRQASTPSPRSARNPNSAIVTRALINLRGRPRIQAAAQCDQASWVTTSCVQRQQNPATG